MVRRVVVVTLALLGLQLACGERPSSIVAPEAPRLAVVMNERDLPFSFFVSGGCGEGVMVQGVSHLLVATDSAPGHAPRHLSVHVRDTGTGIGVTSGSSYSFTDQTSNVANWGDDRVPLEFTMERRIRLVSRDTMPDQYMRGRTHFTINALGDEVVSFGDWECR